MTEPPYFPPTTSQTGGTAGEPTGTTAATVSIQMDSSNPLAPIVEQLEQYDTQMKIKHVFMTQQQQVAGPNISPILAFASRDSINEFLSGKSQMLDSLKCSKHIANGLKLSFQIMTSMTMSISAFKEKLKGRSRIQMRLEKTWMGMWIDNIAGLDIKTEDSDGFA